MSKGSKKTAKAQATASEQTAKRHTTVPPGSTGATVARPATAPSVAVPVVAAVGQGRDHCRDRSCRACGKRAG